MLKTLYEKLRCNHLFYYKPIQTSLQYTSYLILNKLFLKKLLLILSMTIDLLFKSKLKNRNKSVRIIKKKLLVLIIVVGIVIPSCDTTDPKPPEEKPLGYQEDIPWPSLANSPWPMSQHDPQNTGRTNVVGPQSLNILWSKFIENGLLSGPVIDIENNLYFGNDNHLSDYFYCITAKSDSFKWKIKTGDGHRISDGMIITSSGNIICRGFGYIYSISNEGKLNWKYPFDGQRQNFNISKDGSLFAIDGNNNLIKLSPKGELLFQKKYDKGFYPGTAITTDGNEIILNGRNGDLYCIDFNGMIVWQKYSGISNITPLIDSNGKIYICTIGFEGKVKRYNNDGVLDWEYEVPNGILDVGDPTIDKNGNFYFYGAADTLSGYLSIYSIDYNGKKRWNYPLNDERNEGYIASKIACDIVGNLYFGSDQGYYYYCLDFNGNLLWQYSLDGVQIDGTPAFGSDGTLYFGGHDGTYGKDNLFGIGKN